MSGTLRFDLHAAIIWLRGHLQRLFPLVGTDGYAEPWRRFVAATLDTLLLAMAILVSVILVEAEIQNSEPAVHMVAVGAPIVCWLYVLVCWSFGTSAGKWMMGIRIVRLDGKRPGLWTATKRCAGYLIATFPVKLGLAPIRSGWTSTPTGGRI